MEKHSETVRESPDHSLSDKLQTTHLEHMSKAERKASIDAIAERPDVTLESFAHLDLKKVWKLLRSVSRVTANDNLRSSARLMFISSLC